MVHFAIPTLAAQCVTAIYHPIKDLFLYVKGQRQDIKQLEDRIETLLRTLTSIMSRKEGIDRSLQTSVQTEKSKEYISMEKNITGILKKCNEFITKYARLTNNHSVASTELNVDVAIDILGKIDEIKSKIWTLNFLKLAKLSRSVEKLNKRASEVVDTLKPEYMIHGKIESNREKLHVDNDLPVFDEYVDQVLRYLSEDGNRVAILGPVGVGKTTVLRRLYNRLIDRKSFSDGNNSLRLDYVIWTEYPSEENEKILEKLQNEIMVQLKIDHESSNSIHQNERTITTFLREKKYILLMDHVLSNIDLDKLGLREDHSCGKIVIASNDRKAISLMVEHEVTIKRLEKKDGFKLLENTCGKIYDLRQRESADRIIDGCGEITREIKLIANHLKNNRDEHSWTDVKTILQSDAKSLNLIGLGGVDNVYRLAYENLEMVSKKCLLYGALFPLEHRIYRDYLIECWMAEGFIDENAVQKLRRNRERGHTILGQLTDLHLLEWCLDEKYVKMLPNFRRVALELEGCAIWVPSNDLMPNDTTWMAVTRMSLIDCYAELPEKPQCSNIYTLLLQLKPELRQLADLFFEHMQSLKVLDLNHTEIVQLPSSINKLVNLRSLYLNGCNNLNSLPPEATELKKIEVLDVSGTSIPSLPQEITSMVDLRCLRASFDPHGCNCNSKAKQVNDCVEIIPKNIITNLKKLEELSIDTGLHSYGRPDIAKKVAAELASLEYLTTLCFNFPDMSSLCTFASHSKSFKNTKRGWGIHTFRSFKISIGCQRPKHPYKYDVSDSLAERRLRCSMNERFTQGCKEILKQACAFELIGNEKVVTLSEFDLHSLKFCVVERCKSLENIVDGFMVSEIRGIVEEASMYVLQNLEKLHLYDLPSLQCIWAGDVVPRSLSNLTVLTVNGCPKLTKILDPALAATLPRLKHLKVEDCHKVFKILEVSEEVDLSDTLTSVEIVELSNLPGLKSICTSTSISWNSLKSISITRCSQLSNLSLAKTNAERLSSIDCEKSWWTALQLSDGVKQHLSQFCRFKEDPSVLGAHQQGEASTSRRSDFDLASNRVDPVPAKETLSNGCLVDNGAKGPEEEMPDHDDLPASCLDSQLDNDDGMTKQRQAQFCLCGFQT